MRRLVFLVSLAAGISPPAFAQSSVVFDAATTIEVTGTADITADAVTINGTFTGDGTINGSPLPVTLVSFTAQLNSHGPGVLLEWVTVTEINNYGFFVQCRLDSHQSFQDVPNSFVAGHGTTIEQHRYSYIHSEGVAGQHAYRLKQIDLDGSVHYPQTAGLKISQSELVEEKPTEFSLSQNYPNPFNPGTSIRYGLPQKSAVHLAVFNTLGQQVVVLVNAEQEAGFHETRFDATGFSSGVYLYRLQVGNFVQTRKLLFLK